MNERNIHNAEVPMMIGVKKAANLLGVSPRTIWRMIADQQLQAVRFRHCTRLVMAEVLAIINPRGKASGL